MARPAVVSTNNNQAGFGFGGALGAVSGCGSPHRTSDARAPGRDRLLLVVSDTVAAAQMSDHQCQSLHFLVERGACRRISLRNLSGDLRLLLEATPTWSIHMGIATRFDGALVVATAATEDGRPRGRRRVLDRQPVGTSPRRTRISGPAHPGARLRVPESWAALPRNSRSDRSLPAAASKRQLERRPVRQD